MDAADLLARIRVVLARPSHPGNIGAAARAMKTMGLLDLRLVSPRSFPHEEATAMAAGAADLLARARVHETLEEALADSTHAVGFSARGRDLSHEGEAIRDCAPAILEAAGSGSVALVFGNETSGLSNEELLRCARLAHIPSNPAYGSLNLAAAVQIACYEMATLARAHALPASGGGDPATGEDVAGLMAHLEAAVLASGHLDPERPGRLMERMRRLFGRARLERQEVRLLRGILAAFEERMRR